ncbi:hypothetical protein AB0F52_46445 [Amycolatopsis sp. NPDC024027]|uniref:hypothetical protein n=1 Tax=Amycolatopsis sp. NPDC024027 TaxID=3154327 RepID=UPI0033FA2734
MKFQVLGPVAAILGDRPVPLDGPKPRAVLAALLLQANQVVSEQRLYSLLWGDRPPATAADLRLRSAQAARAGGDSS